MNEETQEVIEQPVEVNSAELHDIVNVINKQTYEMQLDHIETKTEINELNESINQLIEIIQSQQPTPEEKQTQVTMTEDNQATLDNINNEMQLMNQQLIALTEEMPKEKTVVEGNYFVGLSVVIAFGVYMFWNQLSKW